MIDDEITASGRPVFLRALRAALARPPLVLLCWLVPFVLGLALVGPWMNWLSETTNENYEAGSVLASMNETFPQDHRVALDDLRTQGGSTAALLGMLMILVGVFSAGGWLQVFLERSSGHSVRRFLWGGAKYFWRFLRVGVLTILTLALFAWVIHGWPWETLLELVYGAKEGNLEVLESEWTAVWITWIQAGLFAAAFALLLTWGDYTRTRMALHDGRSALWAGICTWFLILAHPIRTLRPFVFLLLIEVGVVYLAGSRSWPVNSSLDSESTWVTILVLFLIGQAAMLWQTVSRAARYSAAVQISKRLVAPLSQPDPWASRIGGPGGPQYPIDQSDDGGVSI